MNPITNLIKGDSITFEASIPENITNWKIRCEIYTATLSLKKATLNSGGSNSQIEITDAVNGKFIINIEKDETTNADLNTKIEIEVETSDGKKYTIYQNTMIFIPERIKWSTP